MAKLKLEKSDVFPPSSSSSSSFFFLIFVESNLHGAIDVEADDFSFCPQVCCTG